jgi:hypothetical protein
VGEKLIWHRINGRENSCMCGFIFMGCDRDGNRSSTMKKWINRLWQVASLCLDKLLEFKPKK